MSESLTVNVSLFCLSVVIIAFAGTKLTQIADRIAEITGIGEAIVGVLILGGATSVSGIVTSVVAAAEGHPDLAVSNALGGIALQTAFLGVADLFYRKANLEYAAASLTTVVQGTILITLLTIPLIAMAAPSVVAWSIHPASLIIPFGYIIGLRLSSEARSSPMWKPLDQMETADDKAELNKTAQPSLSKLSFYFGALTLIIAGAGYGVALTGIAIAEQTGFSETIVGGLITAVTNSLPELVTSVAAVRQGALTLAVSGIIGGNSFDILLVALSDVAYRQGSIYQVLTEKQIFIIALTILMIGILIVGLLRREKYGIAKIGLESLLVLVLYLGGFLLLFWWQ